MNTFLCHSGAPRSGEPGIQSFPDSLASLGFRNDGVLR